MHRVHFRNEDATIEVPAGTNLRQACLDYGIDPYPILEGKLSCRGKGLCGTCAVEVDEPSNLSMPDKREAAWIKKLAPELAETTRLSCRACVEGDLIVTTDPPISLIDTNPLLPSFLSSGGRQTWKQHPYYSGHSVNSWEQKKKDDDEGEG